MGENEKQAGKKKSCREIISTMKQHPILASVAIALLCGILGASVFCLDIMIRNYDTVWEFIVGVGEILGSILWLGAVFGAFLVYPVILSVINLVGVFVSPKDEKKRRTEKRFEMLTLALGATYTLLFFAITDIQINAQWFEQLYNSQVHQPIWSEGVSTIIALCAVGVIGYLILSRIGLKKLPPLVVVLSMSAMYLGILECILWSIQTVSGRYWVLSVFPVNCVFIAIKTIRYKIYEWNQWKEEEADANGRDEYSDRPILKVVNRILGKAEFWPFLALILMWPLLGILLGILILFGQKPDAMVKAWTETADWRLSQQIAPQNARYDEHYLCTVAAGGHKNIVKPIRMGERHGHRVVVNRQLCIANAFEQILEERTPKFHRMVRHFYDTYGFPISRLIRTKKAADVVYLIMKPLEWIFLIAIYLCDVKPENRIAVQYLPRTKATESRECRGVIS